VSYTIQQGNVIAVDVIDQNGLPGVRYATESPAFPGVWSLDSPVSQTDSRSIGAQVEVLLAMQDYFVDNPTPPGSGSGNGEGGGGDGAGGDPGGI